MPHRSCRGIVTAPNQPAFDFVIAAPRLTTTMATWGEFEADFAVLIRNQERVERAARDRLPPMQAALDGTKEVALSVFAAKLGAQQPPVRLEPIGRIGCAICYDWLFPEAIRQLAANGAEVLLRVSAYMDPWGATEPMNWWTIVNRCRALENTAFVVAANQGASLRHYPPYSWPGGSQIVDFDGRMLALHSSRFPWSPNGASSGPHSGCRRVVPPYQADLR